MQIRNNEVMTSAEQDALAAATCDMCDEPCMSIVCGECCTCRDARKFCADCESSEESKRDRVHARNMNQ